MSDASLSSNWGRADLGDSCFARIFEAFQFPVSLSSLAARVEAFPQNECLVGCLLGTVLKKRVYFPPVSGVEDEEQLCFSCRYHLRSWPGMNMGLPVLRPLLLSNGQVSRHGSPVFEAGEVSGSVTCVEVSFLA